MNLCAGPAVPAQRVASDNIVDDRHQKYCPVRASEVIEQYFPVPGIMAEGLRFDTQDRREITITRSPYIHHWCMLLPAPVSNGSSFSARTKLDCLLDIFPAST